MHRVVAVKIAGLLVAACGIVLLAACAGGGGAGEEKGTVIEIKAGEYTFSPSEISVPAGQTVTIKLKNAGKTEHDLEVQVLRARTEGGGGHTAEGHSGAAPGMVAVHTTKGKTASITFVADHRGTYEFWCTISGHRQQGMVGKLTVV